MSKAIKCDVCKTCFCPEDIESEIIHIDEIVWTNGYSRKNPTLMDNWKSKRNIDLCPDCTWLFNNFFYGTKNCVGLLEKINHDAKLKKGEKNE